MVQVEVSIQDQWTSSRAIAQAEDQAAQGVTEVPINEGQHPGATLILPIAIPQWQHWFQSWLTLLEETLPPASGYELTLRLTDDREIQDLNARYRYQDSPTDVLAFAALEVEGPQRTKEDREPLYLGDIVISVETADQQAQIQGHSLKTELGWLASHGLLHLLGWDHPDTPALEQMLAQQLVLVRAVGISDPILPAIAHLITHLDEGGELSQSESPSEGNGEPLL